MNKKNGNQIFKKNISVSILYLMSADLVNAILGMAFAFILGRYFGAEYLGIYTFSFMLATMLWTLGESGYEIEIPREIARKPELLTGLISDAQSFKIALMLIGFPLFCLYGVLALGEWYFLVIMPWVLPASANMTLRSTCRGLKMFKQVSSIEISAALTLYPVMILALWASGSIAIVFFVLVVIEIAKAFSYLYVVRKVEYFPLAQLFPLQSSSLSYRTLYTRIKERRGITFVNLLTLMQYRSTLIILPLLQNNFMVGVYTVGMRFVSLLRLLPASAINVLLPEFSSENTDKHKSILIKALAYMAIINIVIAYTIFSFAEPIIHITFKIPEASNLLKVMIWAIIPISLHQIIESFLLSRKMETQVSKSLLSIAILIFISSPVVNFFYGINGIAYIFVVCEIVLLALYIILLRRSGQR